MLHAAWKEVQVRNISALWSVLRLVDEYNLYNLYNLLLIGSVMGTNGLHVPVLPFLLSLFC